MSAVVEYADAARKYLLRFLNRKRVFYFKASSIDFFKAVILLLQLSIPRIEIIQVTLPKHNISQFTPHGLINCALICSSRRV